MGRFGDALNAGLNGSARFLAAWLLAGICTCLPATAAITTFAFEFTGTGSSSGLTYQSSGTGTASPFGSTSFTTSGTITPTGTSTGTVAGSLTFTFSDGESFSATYSGANLLVTNGGSQANGTATINAGTGEFQNASGSLTLVIVSVNSGPHTSAFTVTGSGSITTRNPVLSHYVIAHFPFGGGWSTLVLLANNGASDAAVNLSFFNAAGAPTPVLLEGLGAEGSQQVVVHANSTQAIGAELIQRNSLATTQTVWATASSTAPLNVFSLFDYGPNPPTITGSVGAQSTASSKSFRFPIRVGGPLSYNAGMALANPNVSQTTITVKVFNADGSLNGSFPEILAANAQTIFLLNQKMSFTSALFTGSVAVCASQPVGLVAIGAEGGSTGLFTIAVTTDPCP